MLTIPLPIPAGVLCDSSTGYQNRRLLAVPSNAESNVLQESPAGALASVKEPCHHSQCVAKCALNGTCSGLLFAVALSPRETVTFVYAVDKTLVSETTSSKI